MSIFDRLRLAVEKMERGDYPPPNVSNSDRIAAVKSLVDQVCSISWKTAQEKEQAQGLVARLERLKYALQERKEQPPTP